MLTVQCPNCKKNVVWSKDSPFRPFCSERCSLIDLGAWADGSYTIPASELNHDASESEDKTDPNSHADSDHFDDPAANDP